jgi:hypothetical protein
MKLYTVVVPNLQMCMKEYRCCLEFRREDNSTYTFTKRGVVYLVSVAYSSVNQIIILVTANVNLSTEPVNQVIILVTVNVNLSTEPVNQVII